MTSLIIGLMFATLNPALAANPVAKPAPKTDYFSAGSVPTTVSPLQSFKAATQGSFPLNSNNGSPAVKWFDSFDEAVFGKKVTEAEQVILGRPFKQEVERVQEWTSVAGKVAKRYRELAHTLKAMDVPSTLPGVKEYRDLTADWYGDAAGVYEDLIKPRRPSKTMEELDATLDEIKTRAESLSRTNANLKNMDSSLRRTYRVHMNKTTDTFGQYIRSK